MRGRHKSACLISFSNTLWRLLAGDSCMGNGRRAHGKCGEGGRGEFEMLLRCSSYKCPRVCPVGRQRSA